jgi:hypothetical protein
MRPETWIAVYAAIVATAAVVLNFRSWFEKRVRLNLTVIPDAVLFGGHGVDTEKDVMSVTVVNRGGQMTTLTHLVILRFDSFWKRWRMTPSKSYIIPNPQVAPGSFRLNSMRGRNGPAWRASGRMSSRICRTENTMLEFMPRTEIARIFFEFQSHVQGCR